MQEYRQMYSVKVIEEMTPETRGTYEVYNYAGDKVATLADGYGIAIVMKFYHMSTVDPKRGDDFMAGVLDGIIHMEMLRREGKIPN